MAETTPLLVDTEDNDLVRNSGEEYVAQNVEALGAEFPTTVNFKLIRTLRTVSLISSALAVPILIAIYVIANHAPSNNTGNTRRESKKLGIYMLVSLVFSTINILINFPVLLSVIVDGMLTYLIIPRVFLFLETFPGRYWCYNGNWVGLLPVVPNPGQNPNCQYWKSVVTVLTGIATGLGGIICAIYLILLLLQIVAVVKTKRSFPWGIPAGEMKLEFKVKISRQESVPDWNIQG